MILNQAILNQIVRKSAVVAATDANWIAVAADKRMVVTQLRVLSDTGGGTVTIALGSTTILFVNEAYDNNCKSSGKVGDGSGVVAVGGLGEDLAVTLVTLDDVTVEVTYYLVTK